MFTDKDKCEWRTKLKRMRETLYSPQTCGRIAEQFFASPFFAAEDFFVYLSFGSEVDTKEIISRLQEAGKTVCVPFIGDGQMESVILEGRLRKTPLGFLQPERAHVRTCAVALVPLLGIDQKGNRLGYGGGYYDRYFERHPEIVKVGLGFSGQVLPHIPHEETDIPLDAVITEQGTCIFA